MKLLSWKIKSRKVHKTICNKKTKKMKWIKKSTSVQFNTDSNAYIFPQKKKNKKLLWFSEAYWRKWNFSFIWILKSLILIEKIIIIIVFVEKEKSFEQ